MKAGPKNGNPEAVKKARQRYEVAQGKRHHFRVRWAKWKHIARKRKHTLERAIKRAQRHQPGHEIQHWLDGIVDFALWGKNNAAQLHYSQGGARMDHVAKGKTRLLPGWFDCSSFTTCAAFEAGAPDPNGLGYNHQGFCHEPSARILTSDLRWIAAGDIEVGQEIWAFDEEITSMAGHGKGFGRGRGFTRAEVIASFLSEKECVEVELDSGETLVCSADHPWLSCGSLVGSNRECHQWTTAATLLDRPKLIRPFMPWDSAADSYEAGWLAGMFDGEGWVINRGIRGGRTSGLGVTQVVGPTAERLERLANQYGDFATRVVERPDCQKRLEITSNGRGLQGVAEFLGVIRPGRLINNFELTGGAVQQRHPARAVGVRPVGVREVQSIQTTAATYIAEGFAVHNTGTQYNTCRHVPKSKAKPGYFLEHGGYPGSHINILIESGKKADPLVVSMGQEAGPSVYPMSVEVRAHSGQSVNFLDPTHHQ